ncbi:hypothetical protein ARMA_2991 [Ardenticatena maritima]|uniref:Uncharacterized protein n=1 Tax=Ardenticatena maritima TaxID=872965 RepID=A0A0M9UE00_9CHLR|nr:hypothetical protein [Ardenticatena maritima]GAP64568.1 hypothetical protein ARMA_2991 [Ardenticatena maritima]
MQNLYTVKEVLNYGGFFGGDTVSFIATRFDDPEGREYDFTVDEGVFTNITERHKVVEGMVLALDVAESGRVEAAEVVAAQSREALRAAIRDDAHEEKPYRVFAYKCPACGLWVHGEPDHLGGNEYRCRVCQATFTA